MIPFCAGLFCGTAEAAGALDKDLEKAQAELSTLQSDLNAKSDERDQLMRDRETECYNFFGTTSCMTTKLDGTIVSLGEEMKKIDGDIKYKYEEISHLQQRIDSVVNGTEGGVGDSGGFSETIGIECSTIEECELKITLQNITFQGVQGDLSKCQKERAELTGSIKCDEYQKITKEIGMRITVLRIAALGKKTVDVKNTLKLDNQKTFKDAEGFLGGVIDLLVKMVGLAAFVFLMIGGFRMVVAAGNDNEIQKAKSMIQYAVIGLVVALLAYIIVSTVQGVLYR